MTPHEILETAAKRFELGDIPAAEVLIAEYEEKRKTGSAEPIVVTKGDAFKDILIDRINTKEALQRAPEVCGAL